MSILVNASTKVLCQGFTGARIGFLWDGVEVEQDFWKQRGIDPRSLNVVDGSGPVTHRAEATPACPERPASL